MTGERWNSGATTHTGRHVEGRGWWSLTEGVKSLRGSPRSARAPRVARLVYLAISAFLIASGLFRGASSFLGFVFHGDHCTARITTPSLFSLGYHYHLCSKTGQSLRHCSHSLFPDGLVSSRKLGLQSKFNATDSHHTGSTLQCDILRLFYVFSTQTD